MPVSIRLATSASPRASVVIPVAAPPALLTACLQSLARHSPATPWQAIVVCHGSSAERAQDLTATVAGIEIVSTPVDLGLAGACNRARQQARGEFMVVLHDDTEVEPGWLDALVQAADEQPEAGAIGSKVLEMSGALQSAGSILWRDAATSPPWLGPAPPSAAFDRRRRVDYCGSSSLLVRTATWDAIGGLEERLFPAYFVDVDLAMAVRRHGQAVLFEPRSRVRHHRGASTDPRLRLFLGARNHRIFQAKWAPELAAHEPYEPDSAAAIERALARAAAAGVPQLPAAAAPPGPPPELPGPLAIRPAFDAAAQERRLLELASDLHRAYAAHLSAALDHLPPAPPATDPALTEVDRAELAELRRRNETLAAIERGRLWRTYQRLLPLLRLFRRRY